MPVPGIVSHPARNYETDQSTKLSITGSGTSFIAGQTLSSSDDKWLRKIGAEQKLFDGVTISGSIGETASGAANKSFTAGFKRSSGEAKTSLILDKFSSCDRPCPLSSCGQALLENAV